jgi:hypothetical protein
MLFVAVLLGGCQSEQPATVDRQSSNSQANETKAAVDVQSTPNQSALESSEPASSFRPTAGKTTLENKSTDTNVLGANSNTELESDDVAKVSGLANKTQQSAAEQSEDDAAEQTIEIPSHWKRLGKNEIWVDMKAKHVIFAGTICMNNGQLEMFVCPTNTKEHESVIAAHAMSSEVHASLIAVGANPGQPASWEPEYKPATGPTIDVNITWRDDEKNKNVTRSARSMIRDVRTKKEMTHQWVFGGSQIYVDPDNGDRIYYGDSGELICLSNFSTATMDLNVESSESNAGLLFETFTENIPPLGTKVYVQLIPGKRIEAKSKESEGKESEGKEAKGKNGEGGDTKSETPSNEKKQMTR